MAKDMHTEREKMLESSKQIPTLTKAAQNFPKGIQIAKRRFKFSSLTQTCTTLCNPMKRSTPGLPVQLPEFTKTHVH